MEVSDLGSGMQGDAVESWSALLFDRGRVGGPLRGSDSHLVIKQVGGRGSSQGFSWLCLWPAGQGWVGCPGPRGLCRGPPQTLASTVQLSGRVCGHTATSGEEPSTRGRGG